MRQNFMRWFLYFSKISLRNISYLSQKPIIFVVIAYFLVYLDGKDQVV